MPLNARELAISGEAHGRSLSYSVVIDGRPYRPIRVTFPFDIDSVPEALSVLGLALSSFIGSLCLAERITVSPAACPGAAEALEPITEMLYLIRSWKDARVEPILPQLISSVNRSAMPRPEARPLRDNASLLLWSGGKDSTYSAMMLRANGVDVVALHLSINEGVADLEDRAVRLLSPVLGISPQFVRFEFPDFLALSRIYAVTWDEFPLYNHVPFGRDLITAVVGAISAVSLNCGYVSLGHDHECKTAHVLYAGRSVPRNDVESSEGAIALERFLRSGLQTEISLLPPLAALSELRVLREMLTRHPTIMKQTAFCFWGNNCGQCSKCLRYYLAARIFGAEDVLEFRLNPLEGNNSPELAEYVGQSDEALSLFGDQVGFCLASLIARRDVRPHESLLRKFGETVYPQLAPTLERLEASLFATHHDSQLPGWWSSESFDWNMTNGSLKLDESNP